MLKFFSNKEMFSLTTNSTATNMHEALTDLAHALRTKGLWDDALVVAMPLVSAGHRGGYFEMDDWEEGTDNPFWWMFQEDEDQVELENMQMELYIAWAFLLGRDLIAEQNPGRSKGFLEFVRRHGAQLPITADEGRSLYRAKRLQEFLQAPGKKRFLDQWDALPADLSDPEADEAAQAILDLAQHGIDQRAARGREVVNKRLKKEIEV